MSTPATAAPRPAVAPLDRSISPAIMRKLIAKAASPRKLPCSAMRTRLAGFAMLLLAGRENDEKHHHGDKHPNLRDAQQALVSGCL